MFLLLPLLEAGGTCFSPLSQFLVGSSAVLLGVAGVTARACAVCEQREGFGGSPEDVLVRLDRAKASSLLAAKIRRTAALLQARSAAASHRARAAGGSFFAGTTAGGGAAHAGGAGAAGVPATAVALASEVDMAVDSVHMEAALGLFADYLSDAWLLTLATELSCVCVSGGSLSVVLRWLEENGCGRMRAAPSHQAIPLHAFSPRQDLSRGEPPMACSCFAPRCCRCVFNRRSGRWGRERRRRWS